MQPSHKLIEIKPGDPNEYWRKFVFDDYDDDDEDIQEEDDKTTAAQPAVSAWPSSSPKQNSRSARPDLASKTSMINNTSPSDASFTFRARADPSIREQYSSKAHASTSAALSMKNNVSNPSDSSAETDAPVKSKVRGRSGRSGKSNEVRKKEIVHPSPDLRQQVAAQGQPVMMCTRPDRFAGDMSSVGKGMAGAVTGGCGRGGSKPDRGVGAGDARKERSGRWVQEKKQGSGRMRDVYDWPGSEENGEE